MLTIEEWSRGPGTHPAVKGLIWYTDGYKTPGRAGAEVYGQSLGRKVYITLGKCATVFQD
jgi:hypothetical protein